MASSACLLFSLSSYFRHILPLFREFHIFFFCLSSFLECFSFQIFAIFSFSSFFRHRSSSGAHAAISSSSYSETATTAVFLFLLLCLPRYSYFIHTFQAFISEFILSPFSLLYSLIQSREYRPFCSSSIPSSSHYFHLSFSFPDLRPSYFVPASIPPSFYSALA